VHSTRPFTSATASNEVEVVVYESSAPPAPVDEVQVIAHVIDSDVAKW
jgi:hypothetical protein